MQENELTFRVKGVDLGGNLELPEQASSLIIFAHGSGSSRHSPRNQKVANVLRSAGLGTFLFDLLTPAEEESEAASGRLRFNIPFLAERLVLATRWVLDTASSRDLNAGYFGASTGAAAALVAAGELGTDVGAVVSRGGRPDLAEDSLEKVTAPTLLIVGGADLPVIPLNEEAYSRLRCERALRIVPRASHLFEEPGTLDIVAKMAAEWFCEHLQPLATESRR
jgi:putative phosphoribosyl transferase